MIPFAMVVLNVLRHRAPEVRSPIGIARSRQSSLVDRTKRSAWAFAFGARSGISTTRMPTSLNRRRTSRLHFRSRSQIFARFGRRIARKLVRFDTLQGCVEVNRVFKRGPTLPSSSRSTSDSDRSAAADRG